MAATAVFMTWTQVSVLLCIIFGHRVMKNSHRRWNKYNKCSPLCRKQGVILTKPSYLSNLKNAVDWSKQWCQRMTHWNAQDASKIRTLKNPQNVIFWNKISLFLQLSPSTRQAWIYTLDYPLHPFISAYLICWPYCSLALPLTDPAWKTYECLSLSPLVGFGKVWN